MSKQGSSRKSLIIGIIAAVVVLAALLGVLLTQCTGTAAEPTQSTPAQTTVEEIPTYDLYWNLDRAEFDGKSEAGMSSRQQESDGYFHIRFFKDGEILDLRAADRKVINAVDVNDLMGLEFDDNGIIIGVTALDDLPVEQVGWQFYVQSVGGKMLKLNSSKSFNGLEVLLDIESDTGIYDMTGMEGEVGMSITPIAGDRVIALADLGGKLTHVFVYDRPEFMKTFTAYCEHCKKDAEWKMWTKTSELPSDTGHYQLQNNISGMSKQQYINEDQKVCLDLNGMQVDGKENARVYTLHYPSAHLAIMDTSEGQKGVLRGHSTASDQGGVVWVRYGQFHLYAGTLDASDMICKLNGAAMDIPAGAYFYMHGGKIIGGTAKAIKNDKGNWTNGIGGTMVVRGKFVMNGGVIEGGKALGVVTKYNADGTPNTYARGYAGNIYVGSGGVVEMNGGTIKNGSATHSGGNVYVDGTGEFTMNGGTIEGGRVTGKGRNGGNVFVTTKSTFTLKSGRIVNGITFNCGANVYNNGKLFVTGGYIGNGKIYTWGTNKRNTTDARVNIFNVNGKFYMYGGNVDGGVYVIDTSATDNNQAYVYLTTHATIYGSEKNEFDDLVLATGGSGVIVDVGNLRDTAKIGINASGIFTNPTLEKNLKNFVSNVEGAEVCYVDGRLGLGRMNCICGTNAQGEHYGECDGAQLFWGPLKGNDLPTTSGNFYLANDFTAKAQSSIAENATIRLDLNGKTLTANPNYRGWSLHNPGAYLVITDTTEGKTGVIKSTGEGTTQGNVVWVRYGRFDLYGGTLDGSGYQLYKSWEAGTDGVFGTSDDKESDRAGGTVCMAGSTTFNMWGGTIIGNQMKGKELTKTVTTTVDGESVKTEVKRTVGTNGGASLYVPNKAVFNMYAGEIRDGYSADRGGNVQIYGGGNANLYGGVIKNGKTDQWGGNIHMDGASTLNIDGVTISGGESKKNGGSIYSGNANATINVISGLIENGKTTGDQGGNIFNSGYLNITGGTITGGRTEANKNGGNIAINSSRDVVITGGTISNGYSNGTGGNIGVSSTNTNGSLTIGGTAVITDGYAKNNGGNIYVQPNNANKNNPNVRLTITGGTISNGEAVNDGGNIYLGASGEGVAQATVTGGTITGGLAKTGGNIRVNGAAAEFVVDGANVLIEKGTTNNSGHGGNVNTSGSFTLANGIIRDGVSVNTAGNVYINGSGKLVVLGGKILGGTDKNGANAVDSSVYSVCAGLEIRGGEMDGGICIINYNNNNGWVKMSGNPVIKSSTRAGLALNWSNGSGGTASQVPHIEIDAPMTEGAEVYLTSTKWETGKMTKETDEAYTKYFHADDKTRSIGYANGVIMLGKTHCLCGSTTGTHKAGCDGKQLFWQPISSSSKLPTTSGNYYIHPSVTVTLTEQWRPAADAVINLDLAGRSVTNAYRVMAINNANVNLTITDTVGGGKIYKTGTYSGQGGILWIQSGSTVKMIAGTIDGTEYTNGSNGGAVCIEGTGSKFYMYGGTIKGTGSATNGGNVALKGTNCEMHMYGGSIEGGRAYGTGGNIYIASTGSKLYIRGGSITGGLAGKDYVSGSTQNGWGGNIEMTTGEIYMYGGTISGGRTTGNGGNIRLSHAGGTMNISGGLITDGQSGDNGGNIFLQGTLTVTGGVIKDGSAVKGGGNIAMNSTKSISLSNTTISGGQAGSWEAGNIEIWSSTPESVTFGPGTVITGGTTNYSNQNGANVYISNLATNVTINGAKIDGYVRIAGANTQVTVSGKTVIAGGETNLTIPGALTVSNLASDASIGVTLTTSEGKGVFTNAVEEAVLGNFVSDSDLLKVIRNDEGKLEVVVNDNPYYHCICGNSTAHMEGCDGTKHQFIEWTSTTSLPLTSGYYYLANNVELSAQQKVTAVANIVLDLNGKTVSNKAGAAIRCYWLAAEAAELTVLDTVGGGKLVNNGAYDQGGIFWIQAKNTEVTIYNAILDASGYTCLMNGDAPKSNGGGAAICLANAGCTFTMYDGQLLGGTSYYGGGAIFGENWDSRVNILGGTVTGNENETYEAIRLMGTKNVFSDCTITGGVEVNTMRFESEGEIDMLTLSGDVQVDYVLLTDEAVDHTGYGTVLKRPTIIVKDLGDDASVEITTLDETPYIITKSAVAEGVEEKIVAVATADLLMTRNADGKLELLGGENVYCLCDSSTEEHAEGCDGTKYLWTALTKIEDVQTPGNYYLTQNLNVTGQYTFKAGTTRVDFKGYTITDTSNRLFTTNNSTNAKVFFTDTSAEKKGGITISYANSATYAGQGAAFWVAGSGCELNWINGVIDVSNCRVTSYGGAAVYVAGNTTFNMYNGLITGGTTMGVHGGNIGIHGTMNMYGGTITGGKAEKNSGGTAGHGGNIALLNTNAVLNMSGGEISNGTGVQWGGNIYMYPGTFNMSGGKIFGGKINTSAKNDNANITMRDGAVMDLSGGSISGRIVMAQNTNVGTVKLSGSIKLLDLTLGDGNTDDGYRLKLYPVDANGTTNINLIIGKLNADAMLSITNSYRDFTVDGASVRVNVKGAFATAAEGYTLTAEDLAAVKVWYVSKSTAGFATSSALENGQLVFK